MSLQVLGVGLPRTGTMSLCRALRILGYNTVHYSPERAIQAGMEQSWRVYDDVDAAADFPAALQWKELDFLYGPLKLILTIREPRDSWFASIRGFGKQLDTWVGDNPYRAVMDSIADYWWGPRPHTRDGIIAWYDTWIRDVMKIAPAERLLVYNLCGGDGWEPLCRFLGKPVPDEPFPWENKRGAPT